MTSSNNTVSVSVFSARQHSICLARKMLSAVRPSVRHTGGSIKNG